MTFPSNDSIYTYGGIFVDGGSVVDPTTDLSAAQYNTLSASVASMTATCPVAWFRFVTSATTPTLAASKSNNAAWGNGVGVRPVLARSGAGIFTATFPTTITDGVGTVQTVNLGRALPTIEGATLGFVQALVTSANVVTVYTFNTSFATNDLVGVTVHVQLGY